MNKSSHRRRSLPRPLTQGDLVAIAAPSGAVRRKEFLAGAEFIASRGFRVTYREDIFARERYLAGDDQRRAEELNGHLGDKEVKAILFARGGYGSSRIMHLLRPGPLRRNPKIIAGYSDITLLLNHLHQRWRIAVFHGPFVSEGGSEQGKRNIAVLLKTLSGKNGPLVFRGLRTLRSGRITAPVTGGNLTMLAHSLGTPYAVKTAGSILFVEEVNEAPYRVDRMVRQLHMAGVFKGIRGLLIGSLPGAGAPRGQLEDLLVDAVAGRRVPVLAGFPAGHGKRNRTFPLGVKAAIDTADGAVRFAEFLRES